MPRKSVKKNYLYNVFFQVLSLCVPLLSTPYLSRVLGPDGIGYYSFHNSISSYFVLFATLGTTTFGQREISFYQDNILERSKVFWENVTLRCITVTMALIAWNVYLHLQSSENRLFLGILSFNIIGVVADISWFFQGMEEFGKTISKNTLFKIINLILVLTLIREKSDLIIYVLLLLGLNLVGNVSLWIYLPKYICRVKFIDLKPFRNIKTVFSLFIPSIAIQIYTVLDKTMIGYFNKSSYENGYYELAMNMSKMILSIVTSMGVVLAPRTAYYYETKDEINLKSYLYRSYRFVWFLATPLSLGLLGIAANLVPWFWGEDYKNMVPVLRVSSLLIAIIGMNGVTGAQYMIPTERQNSYTFTVLIGSVCNFIMNLVLIPRYFALGAVCSSVAAETLIMLVQFYVLRKNINLKKIFSFSKNYLIAGLSMLIILFFEDRCFNASLINTFLMIFSGGIVYFGMLTMLRDSFYKENVNRILDVIRSVVIKQ